MKYGNYLGILQAKDKAVITSADMRDTLKKMGRTITISLILPPAPGGERTYLRHRGGGWGRGQRHDVRRLSTALFVMGEDRALELWRSGVYDFDLILVTEDGRLLATAGIADRFRPDDSAGYAYEIVS